MGAWYAAESGARCSASHTACCASYSGAGPRSAARGMMFAFGMGKVDNERLLEWLVRGSDTCTIIARSEKGGTVRRVVELA